MLLSGALYCKEEGEEKTRKRRRKKITFVST